MEFENKNIPILVDDAEYLNDTINIRELIEKYLYHWKWIVLGITIAIGLAYFMLSRTSNQYLAQSSVLIESNETGGASELSAFSDLSLFRKGKTPLENEIGIFKSLTLMEGVVKKLKLNITYHDASQKANTELYGVKTPFKVNFFIPDSVLFKLDISFVITQLSKTTFEISNEEGTIKQIAEFGKNIKNSFGVINVTPSNSKGGFVNFPVLIKIQRVSNVIVNYRNNLMVPAPDNNQSSLLTLSLVGPVLQKSKDILNEVVNQYNAQGIAYRNLMTNNTDEFINSRIDDISNELSNVDQGVQEFKTKNRLTDMSFEAEIALQNNSIVERKIVDLNSQIKLIEYIIDYLKSNTEELIPTNLGLDDNLTNQNANIYNQLLLEKKRLLKGSSELNPAIINLNEQLSSLRKGISENLSNLRSTLNMSLNDAKMEESRIDSKRFRAPSQEREIQDILRQRQIIESLYLYLLQKREENAIKQGATSPGAKIIDRAFGNPWPVAPNVIKTYAAAGLIGVFFPILIIFIVSLVDNKVHNVEDVEKIISAPILGDIPKVKSKRLINLIKSEERDSLAESFRILRTNLNYMLTHVKNRSKILLITSTVAGEGKTVTTLNLACTLASMDKKVLVIGADLRKPKLTKYTKIEKSTGLTHFLVDETTQIKEIIQSDPINGIDLINSWEIPPNPAELLTNGRFELILDYAKDQYDYVLIDSAPLGLVADTMTLHSYADLVLYVVRINKIDKRLLKMPEKVFKSKRISNMAIVVNGTNYKKDGYGYGYGYT